MKAIMFLAGFMLSSLSFGVVGSKLMPETHSIAGKTLSLNGKGIRKKFFVKVYEAGLYVPKTGMSAKSIIAADEPMNFRIGFLRGVGVDKVVDAQTEGFSQSTATNPGLKPAVDTFNSYFKTDVSEGDVYDFAYTPGTGVQVYINGKEVGNPVAGLAFKQALFTIWLGNEPADEGLKKALVPASH